MAGWNSDLLQKHKLVQDGEEGGIIGELSEGFLNIREDVQSTWGGEEERLAIFHQTCNNEKIHTNNAYTLTRLKTPEAINAFREDLLRQTWDQVYAATEPNEAYNAFMTVLMKLYDKHCPFKKTFHKNQQKLGKPWMTKGIKNACKKKNQLYKIFLKDRNKESETRYKKYKNKLTNIIRTSKKDYYYKILDQHKNNIHNMETYLDKPITTITIMLIT